ncbi:MAG: leucine-rich repeat domain-containing protein [Alphaproteobacteria bacterium]|nr:leucine-rich repeat domain-containing protein [Alphaproteobacteria bacterium]
MTNKILNIAFCFGMFFSCSISYGMSAELESHIRNTQSGFQHHRNKVIPLNEIVNLMSCGNSDSISISPTICEINDNEFYQNNRLKRVSFIADSSCRWIMSSAFAESSLEQINLPSSLWEIEDEAFFNCRFLSIVNFAQNCLLHEIPQMAFSGTAITSICIPRTVEKICCGAFENCVELCEVTFETDSRIERIDEYAFYGCISLTSVTFGERSKLKWIGGGAFIETGLTAINLPRTIEGLYDDVFDSNVNIRFPWGCRVKHFWRYGFPDNVDGIVSLDGRLLVPAGIDMIGKGVLSKYESTHNQKIKNVEFEDQSEILQFDLEPFLELKELAGIKFGLGVEKIFANKNIQNFNSLQYIQLPKSITEVEVGAFHGFWSLQTLSIHMNLAYLISGMNIDVNSEDKKKKMMAKYLSKHLFGLETWNMEFEIVLDDGVTIQIQNL